MTLRQQIEHAFEHTPAPTGPLVTTGIDDEGVSAYFQNKPWRGHRVADLRVHEVALTFFTPEAFRYYLPAFMLASIEDPTAADVIPEGILYHFSTPDDPHQWTRIMSLSPAERTAVVAFLLTLSTGHNDDQIQSALEGLERASSYRAAGPTRTP